MPKLNPKLILALFTVTVILAFTVGYIIPDTPRLTYTVQAGDTLWGIAAERYPDENTARMVGKIERMNELGGLLQPGQQIKLP